MQKRLAGRACHSLDLTRWKRFCKAEVLCMTATSLVYRLLGTPSFVHRNLLLFIIGNKILIVSRLMNGILVKTLVSKFFDFCKFKSLVECVFRVVFTSLLAIVPSTFLRHMDRDQASYIRLAQLLKKKLIIVSTAKSDNRYFYHQCLLSKSCQWFNSFEMQKDGEFLFSYRLKIVYL